MEDRKEELAKAQAELKELKKRLPAHCGGRTYIGHQASIELVEQIDELEDRIKQLRAEA